MSSSAHPTLSPIALGTLMLSAMLLYFWLSGTLFASTDPAPWLTSARATGAALTYSTIPAFLIATWRYAKRRDRLTLRQLVASGSLPREMAPSTDMVISGAQNAAATIAGLILGSLNAPWARLWEDLGEPAMFVSISLGVGNLMIWLFVAHVLLRRLLASNALRRLGRDHAKVDLLRLDALLPLGRTGTFDVMVVAITVSLTAFQSLDAELRWINYVWAFGAGVPAGFTVLLLPMIGIRQSVRRVKQVALTELDSAIAAADRQLEATPLNTLNNLLRRREAIAQAREWPLDTTALSRVAIYFIIPPLAWAGAAMMEILIETLLDSGR